LEKPVGTNSKQIGINKLWGAFLITIQYYAGIAIIKCKFCIITIRHAW
jgi:hypothetical protein